MKQLFEFAECKWWQLKKNNKSQTYEFCENLSVLQLVPDDYELQMSEWQVKNSLVYKKAKLPQGAYMGALKIVGAHGY